MAGETVLVIDDEIEIGEIIRDYLEAEGYKVYIAIDGEEGLKYFKRVEPSLIILDIMLPMMDGMEVCRLMRSTSNIPIIMLSAKREDTDKIISLGLGADDYMIKPFSPGELMARVKAQLRRYMYSEALVKPSNILTFDKLMIDDKAYTVFVDSKDVNFAAKEFELLSYMAKNPNQVFTREQLFNQIWGFDEFGDVTTVTVHIRKIREKIEVNPSEPEFIKTVWGVGYKFCSGKQ
jgi:two-component system response regulator VicR